MPRSASEPLPNPANPSVPATGGTFSIRTLLVVSVLMTVVPAWAFASYVAWKYALAKQQSVEDTGRLTARTVAAAADFRLTSIESAMRALAQSPALRSGDLASFHNEALALAQIHRARVALVMADGRRLIATSTVFGEELPDAEPELRFAEAAASRGTQVSNLHSSGADGRFLVSVAVPILREDPVRQILVVSLDSAHQLGEVLSSIDMPGSWTMSLLDGQNRIAARRPSPEPFVGKPSHPDVLNVLNPAESGWGIGSTIDNKPVHIFYHRLKKAPWTVLVGVPRADIDGAVREAVSPVILAGFLILLGNLTAAWLIGRGFSHQLIDVAQAATAFRGRRRPRREVSTRITELVEMQRTLKSAADERTRIEERLKGLIRDKDMLMQEVHHRVKNSLQLVRGILLLQARGASHPREKEALSEAANRILTVADIHRHLYQGTSITRVELGTYLRELARDLAVSLMTDKAQRQIVVNAPDIAWPSEKVMTLGLIVTELVTNAIKYGEGLVMVDLVAREDGGAVLTVEDQGPGFPPEDKPGAGEDKPGAGRGLGSKLIGSLVRPEEGRITIDRSVSHGRVIIEFDANWRQET